MAVAGRADTEYLAGCSSSLDTQILISVYMALFELECLICHHQMLKQNIAIFKIALM